MMVFSDSALLVFRCAKIAHRNYESESQGLMKNFAVCSKPFATRLRAHFLQLPWCVARSVQQTLIAVQSMRIKKHGHLPRLTFGDRMIARTKVHGPCALIQRPHLFIPL